MKTGKFLSIFGCICLILFIFLSSIYFSTMDKNFYSKQYIKNNTSQYTGMNNEDLNKATDVLIDYLKGKRDNLIVKANVNGQMQEVFTKREKDHMVDVVKLVSLMKNIILFLLIASILCFSIIIWQKRKNSYVLLAKSFINSSIIFYLLIIVLGTIMALNFNFFWVKFHEIAFTNDLWLLDPAESIMINMFPLEFFYACCFKILIIFAISMAVLTIVSFTVKSKFKNS